MTNSPNLDELSARSREVFRVLVEEYLASGEPIGSRSLTQNLKEKVSSATIRNVMQDLERMGLLDSPHVSSGRIPTQVGLRMFVDGFLEAPELAARDRQLLDASLAERDDVVQTMDRVGAALSSLTAGASLVLTPKNTEATIKHIEFVGVSSSQALVVLVFENGQVENRLFDLPPGQTPSSLREAGNFLNAIGEGKSIRELRQSLEREIVARRNELDGLAADLVEAGSVLWFNQGQPGERLIVKGRANLLSSEDDLERIRDLFDDLERKKDIADFLDLTETAEGVRIFIGSENKLFSLSGSSLVVSPYMNVDRKIIGAVGVIGPTRLNYGRVVPIVDYAAQLVGKMVSDRT